MRDDWVAPTCTLPTAERPIRVAEFDDLFRVALRAVDRPGPTRLVLTLTPAPGRPEHVRDLTSRESECCSFFTFTLTEQNQLLLLEIAVPPGHVEVLDALVERAVRVSSVPSAR